MLTFDSDGVYIGKWSAVSPKYNPSNTEDTELRGLTVDSIGQVLVGEIKLKYISKHKSDGRHVKSFEVAITPRSIAVTSQGAIIISDRNKSIHFVDHTGQLLHIVTPPSHVKSWNPAGIACYENLICICNYHEKTIHCFFVSGEYLSDIPISIPGEPRYVAFKPDAKQIIVSCGGFNRDVAVYKLQE